MKFVIRRVLWTLVPICSLGFLGWVPPLRIAIRRQTPAAWLWFAGFAAGTALVIALAETVQDPADPQSGPPAWVGMVIILDIVSAAVYTGIATKALTRKPRMAPLPPQDALPYGYEYAYDYGYAYGHEYRHEYGHDHGGYPGQPAAYPGPPPGPLSPLAPPLDTSSAMPTIVTSPIPPTVVTSPVGPPAAAAAPTLPPPAAPNAVDAAAAEVQAELRKLRDFLGESADGRSQERHDRRGEW